MTNKTLAAALSYLDVGWSVIPVNPKSKVPLVKWKKFEERQPTRGEVRSWWREFPNASVGVVTGEISDLVVVDVDPDKGGDADGWRERQPSILRVKTRRGGEHCYYRHPGNGRVANSVSKIAPGVDVRGDGGYVVAPPSNGYSWQQGGPADAERLASFRRPAAAPGERVGESHRPPDEPWLEHTLRGVGHGERNAACARLAGYFVKKGLPADVIVAQLTAWNQLNDPPLPEGEIRTTVESVARTAADKRVETSRTRFKIVDQDDNAAGPDGSYDVTTFNSYLSKYGGQSVPWLVKDWLPHQTVGLVVAPPGSYKTWLLQDLAVSVASGLPFLGQFPVLKPGPVLFMQQEDWHGQIAHRFALIASRRANIQAPRMVGSRLIVHAPPRLPIYLNESRSFRFDDNDAIDSWIKVIERIRPRLVVLDPLYSAGSVTDFMAGTAREMFLFKNIRDAFGTTFLIAHHTRKAAKPNDMVGGRRAVDAATAPVAPEREDTWGSQFLNAWLETGWQIRKRDELGTASVLRHFKAAQDAKQAVVGFNIDTTQLTGKYEVSVRESQPHIPEEKGPDITGLLDKFGPLTSGQISEKSGQHRTTIHRRIVNLLAAGVITKKGNKYELKEGALDA